MRALILLSNIPSIHEACTGAFSCAATVVPYDLEERTASGHLESRTTYRSSHRRPGVTCATPVVPYNLESRTTYQSSHGVCNLTASFGSREARAEENRIVKERVKNIKIKTVRSGTCSTNVNDGSDTCTYYTNSADRRRRAE